MGWMRALLLCSLTMMAQSAHAEWKPGDQQYNVMVPPPMYDHSYEGKQLTLHNIRLSELQTVCASVIYKGRLDACSFWNADRSECTIYIRNDSIIEEARAMLWRHEVAHCNGWPGGHNLYPRREE